MPPPNHAPGAARARRLETGSAWVSLLLLLAVVAACYLGIMWIPPYVDHYEVKQVTRDFMNQAVKNRDDAALVAKMTRRLGGISMLKGRDEAGNRWEEPVIVVEPEDVLWERDTSVDPPMLRVAFEYEREISYPLLDRTVVATFGVDLEQDLGVPVWETK